MPRLEASSVANYRRRDEAFGTTPRFLPLTAGPVEEVPRCGAAEHAHRQPLGATLARRRLDLLPAWTGVPEQADERGAGEDGPASSPRPSFESLDGRPDDPRISEFPVFEHEDPDLSRGCNDRVARAPFSDP